MLLAPALEGRTDPVVTTRAGGNERCTLERSVLRMVPYSVSCRAAGLTLDLILIKALTETIYPAPSLESDAEASGLVDRRSAFYLLR